MGTKRQRRQPKEEDVDGTLDIARGGEALEEEVSEKKDDPKVDYHLWGAQGDLAKERLEQLKNDDANPDLSSLTPTQIRHLKNRRNPKNKARLQNLETKRLKAAVSALQAVDILQSDQAGVLEAEHELERTTAVTQAELKRKHLDEATARNIFDLQLSDYAPYIVAADRSGRHALLAGQGGHVAILETTNLSMVTEFHLPNERIRDATFLHDFSLSAIAQRNHVYIYDQTGAEIHCLDEHRDPLVLEYLPYHWLLSSIGRTGVLRYQDVSTGQLVATHRTKLGPPGALTQNPANAVLHAGHSNGTVTLWSPASSTYLAKMLCHKGAAILDVAVDLAGQTMVTAGMDRQIKVWDLRMYKERHSYFCRGGVPTSLDISQRNLLAIGHGSHVTLWGADALQQKTKSPYMHHLLGPGGDNYGQGPVHKVCFRPFEDSLWIGHQNGVSSIVVPGAGEPVRDTAEDPIDSKQRREFQVRSLLDKLAPEMITIDCNRIGGVEESDPMTLQERMQDLEAAANRQQITKQKNKKRGRSKIQTKLRRKHKNIIDQNLLKLREAREKEKAATQQQQSEEKPAKESAPAALKRFF